MAATQAKPVPANFSVGGNAARRLVELKESMTAELGRSATYTEVVERLLRAYDFAGGK
jgi:hypothetical protein